jgi:hypothetical protein
MTTTLRDQAAIHLKVSNDLSLSGKGNSEKTNDRKNDIEANSLPSQRRYHNDSMGVIDNPITNSYNNNDLMIINNNKIRALDEKFNKERRKEQERIVRLFEEYSALKKALLTDEIESKQTQDQQLQQSNERIKSLINSKSGVLSHHNRFSGLETTQQCKFRETVYKRFERDALKHANSLQTKSKYDPVLEQKQVFESYLNSIIMS